MTTQTYLQNINQRYKTGISREHTYRSDLQVLLSTLLPEVLVTNEPARVACGAPDYVLTKKDIPVGYIEAKDIGVDLNSKTLKEQFDRYKQGLTNLIFTDYLQFHFYKDGVFTVSVTIAKIENGNIVPIPENFDQFETLIKNFALTISQTIKSPTKLAEMMAGKAKLMADVIEKSLNSDDQSDVRTPLKAQMLSFKQMLIHDIDNSAFADIYSQTIAYGMFAARYHDPSLPTFSRQEAATLIPKSNPFLRKLFQDIAGYDLDDRLVWMVEELVNIFLATDVADIMKNFGKSTKQEDPVVHFYETFLAAYNPALRKARGVWYTPEPVVSFIVRAVDDILKTEFNLPQGLADTTKIKVKTKHVTKATADKRSKLKEVEIEEEAHKVQILDPATGTGTFLAEVVKHIYKKFEGQQGIWSNYVSQHLIPRLNGFELLMASYAMAHLKMDMLLTETGYKPTTDQRFRIFLTNSLEEAHPDTGTLFSSWLSDEADQANAVKRDTPVMVIMGNPPYSVSSTNKGKWIQNLIADYKKDLHERKINLDDDYIKFIRFGEHFIEKNGEGILAFISNNSFIDGVTHRQMRKHLLQTFSKVYILDLHGNSKKKEVSPDGTPDENVFDIMAGVSINIFLKTKLVTSQPNEILHSELFGKRIKKYRFLENNGLKDISWRKLEIISPNYLFKYLNREGATEYEKGFKINDLFLKNSSGIESQRDEVAIHFSRQELEKTIKVFKENNIENIRVKLNLDKDGRDWTIGTAKADLEKGYKTQLLHFKPFDFRLTAFTGNSKGFIAYPRNEVSKHLIAENYCLISPRFFKEKPSYLISDKIIAHKVLSAYDKNFMFPLYLYDDVSNQITIDNKTARMPNLDTNIVERFAAGAGLYFSPEVPPEGVTVETNQFHPIDLLDYIYAVLHSTKYREKYKEFLKIDFPRVPYPTSSKSFFDLVDLGRQLRELHVLKSKETEEYITKYPIDGNNEVGKPIFKEGKVFINENQYFDNVPEVAWSFYIGGYQPAQKWLKDRKGRTLEFDDILHYQKIIKAVSRTGEIMGEIDKFIEV